MNPHAKPMGNIIDWNHIFPKENLQPTLNQNQSTSQEPEDQLAEQEQTNDDNIQFGSGPIDFVVNNLPFEAHLTDIQPNGKKRKYNFAGQPGPQKVYCYHLVTGSP